MPTFAENNIRVCARSGEDNSRTKDLGTLEPGKLVDLVILDGNPLADVSDVLKVKVVVKEGKIVVDKR